MHLILWLIHVLRLGRGESKLKYLVKTQVLGFYNALFNCIEVVEPAFVHRLKHRLVSVPVKYAYKKPAFTGWQST